MYKAYEAYEAHRAYEAYEAYEVRFHAAVAESGTLRSLILALGRFALGENGVTGATMGLPPHALLGALPQTPARNFVPCTLSPLRAYGSIFYY